MRNCIWSIAAVPQPSGRRPALTVPSWRSARRRPHPGHRDPRPRAGTQDLSLIDLSRDRTDPLTTTRGYTGNPVWSADGKRLAYTYRPAGPDDDVYVKDIGTGAIQPVIETPSGGEHPVAWSHDGAFLLVVAYDDDKADLSSWSFASRTLTRFAGPGVLESAAFSPRDDYVAFSSRESGRPEVYVTTFPDRRQTWPLTTEGGTGPELAQRWPRDSGGDALGAHRRPIRSRPRAASRVGQPTTLVRDVGGSGPVQLGHVAITPVSSSA